MHANAFSSSKNCMKSRNSGVQIFSQLDISVSCEYMFLSLGNMFEYLGDNQFLEISEASKEIVIFYDHGFACRDLLTVLTNQSLLATIGS